MMRLVLAAAIFLPVATPEKEPQPETYEAAYKTIVKSGQPMVVMIGADWCGPCQAMRRHILPELRKRRCFGKIAFARVDVDQEAALAKRLTGGGPVPQLIMFRKTKNGWVRRKLIGKQSVEVVEKFVEQGLALDATDRQAAEGRLATLPNTKTTE